LMIILVMYHNFYHNIKLEHENVEIKKSPQLAHYTNQKKNVDVNKLLNKIKMNQLNEVKKKIIFLIFGILLVSLMGIFISVFR